MKPPKHVKVGPHSYSVIVDRHGLMSDMGHCDPDQGIIALHAGQCVSAMRDSLTHEVLHAALAPLNLDDELEERIVSTLSPTWLGVVRDNPRLVAWLTT